MARLPRLCLPGIPQHVIQRGVNRQACFFSDKDFSAYACWLNESAQKHQVAIHAWVFMTNHVHLLVTPECHHGVSKMMQSLGRRYVRYINHTHQRSGTLWEGRFKSCVICAEDYLVTCQKYIELNPVRAGMVKRPEHYTWSSYKTNAMGQSSNICTPHPVYLALGRTTDERLTAYQALFESHTDTHENRNIRSACNKGLALGDDRFKRRVEELSGRRVTALKRGPRKRSQN